MRHTNVGRILPSLPAALGLLLGAGLMTGCADAGGDDAVRFPGSLAPSDPSDLPPNSVLLAEFVAHINPRERKVTFERVATEGPSRGMQSIDELKIVQDGIDNSGPSTTVELVTNSVGSNAECPPGYQTNTFCANVTLRHFYPRSLSNVFVQVKSITPADDHNGLNSDPSEFGLDDTYGLWKYTSPAATTPGVLGQAPHNDGARDWVFADPDGAETNLRFRVVASLKFAGYIFDFGSQAFTDACLLPGGIKTTATKGEQTLPFPFTLYGSTNTVVRYNSRGMITFGNVNGTASGANQPLPYALAPKPAIFAFWDDIKFASAPNAGSMCYKVVGQAPNRHAVITWNNMTFSAAPDALALLQFGAILSEGSNNIELIYNSMNGVTERSSGNSATVGVQNEAASAATAESSEANYGTGNSYAFIPIP